MPSGLPSVELSIMYFKPILKLQNLFSLSFALDYFFGPASARSYKIGVAGNNWLVNWLVGNAVFSETALRVLKKNLDLKIFPKSSPN